MKQLEQKYARIQISAVVEQIGDEKVNDCKFFILYWFSVFVLIYFNIFGFSNEFSGMKFDFKHYNM